MKGKERIDTPVLDQYLTDFELTKEDLRGRILDLGAGMRMLAKEASDLGLARIYSISESRLAWMEVMRMMAMAKRMNPDTEVIKLWGTVDSYSLEGRMQALPFAANSFDLILSRDSLMPRVFEKAEDLIAGYKELVRIIAPGGRAEVLPGWLDNWTDEEKQMALAALSELVKIDGVRVEAIGFSRMVMGMKLGGIKIVLHKD